MNPYLTFVDDQIFYLRNPYNFLDEKPVPRRLRGGRRTEVKPTNLLGRNDPCHCGSGVKYKKCCLNK